MLNSIIFLALYIQTFLKKVKLWGVVFNGIHFNLIYNTKTPLLCIHSAFLHISLQDKTSLPSIHIVSSSTTT